MPDKFDPYREALVVEKETDWAADLPNLSETEREQIATRLHANAQEASELHYVRLPTGFCRRITVTLADVQRFHATRAPS